MESLPYYRSETPITVFDVLRIIARRGWVIVAILAVSIATAAVISYRTPSRWKGDARLILWQRVAPVMQKDSNGGPQQAAETVDTQVAMLKSYGMALRTVSWLQNQANAGAVPSDVAESIDPERFLKDLEVSAVENSNIIEVQVEAENRARAELLTNAVCQAFVEWKKEVAQRDATATRLTLETRVKAARANLVQAEQRVMDFKHTSHLVDVPVEAGRKLQDFLDRDAEYARAQDEVNVQQAKVQTLGRQLAAANAAIRNGSGVRDDSLVLSLQQQIASLEVERANAALKIRPAYPGSGNLGDMDSRIRDLKTRLAKALQGTLDNKRPSLQVQESVLQQYTDARLQLAYSRAKLQAAAAARSKSQSQTKSLPQASLVYARLQRDADVANSLYTSLQSGLNAARLDEDSSSGNVQVTQAAVVPRDPFVPNHARDILFGVAVGLALAFLAVLVLEQADSRLHTVEDIRQLLPGPVVGTLPNWKQDEVRELMAGNPMGPVEEAYSLARVNLTLAVRDQWNGQGAHPQVILVTSAMPGEGKSLTSAQIARSLARAGNTVILVDADLRRPTQNTLFGTDEPSGMADVLVGRMTLDEALVSSDTDNLSILHSGTPDRNPTDLLSLPATARLLEELRREADVVIVDAPACAVVADALILAPHVDCIMHVVSAGLSDAALLRETTAALSAAGPKAMVFFVNRAPSSGRGGYYNRYYSYSGGHDRHGHHDQRETAVVPVSPEETVVDLKGDSE